MSESGREVYAILLHGTDWLVDLIGLYVMDQIGLYILFGLHIIDQIGLQTNLVLICYALNSILSVFVHAHSTRILN